MSKKKKETLLGDAQKSFQKVKRQTKKIGTKIVKKVPKINTQYKLIGKAGKVLGKAATLAVKNPLITLSAAGLGFAAGASTKRYKKAPKFGENRDLNSRLIKRGI